MAEQQTFDVSIPDGYSPDDLAKMGDDIVQFIRDRCAEGQGVRKRGRGYQTYDFPEYTKAYAKRKGSKKVDLVLSEDMLQALDVIKINSDEMTITVGYGKGDPMNGRVEGNCTGSYGQSKPNARRARNFLGLTGDELEAILGVYDQVDKAAQSDDGDKEKDE